MPRKLNDYLFPMLYSPIAAALVTIGVVWLLAWVAGLPYDLSTKAIAFGLALLVWAVLSISGALNVAESVNKKESP